MRAHHLATALLLSLAAAAPAAADTRDGFNFSDPFDGSAECDGFTNNWTGHDRGTVTDFFRNGVPYREIGKIHSIETDVNSVTGKAVTIRSNVTVTGDLDPDGNLTTWKIAGEFQIGNFPGEGIVLHDSGNVRFEDGIPTALHGIHDTFTSEEDPFCAALS
jgi:hypothetical protein